MRVYDQATWTLTVPSENAYIFSPNYAFIEIKQGEFQVNKVTLSANGITLSRSIHDRKCKFDLSGIFESYFNSPNIQFAPANFEFPDQFYKENVILTFDWDGDAIDVEFNLRWGAQQFDQVNDPAEINFPAFEGFPTYVSSSAVYTQADIRPRRIVLSDDNSSYMIQEDGAPYAGQTISTTATLYVGDQVTSSDMSIKSMSPTGGAVFVAQGGTFTLQSMTSERVEITIKSSIGGVEQATAVFSVDKAHDSNGSQAIVFEIEKMDLAIAKNATGVLAPQSARAKRVIKAGSKSEEIGISADIIDFEERNLSPIIKLDSPVFVNALNEDSQMYNKLIIIRRLNNGGSITLSLTASGKGVGANSRVSSQFVVTYEDGSQDYILAAAWFGNSELLSKRYTRTYTATKKVQDIYINTEIVEASGTAELVKVEFGDTATPWQPAPEDATMSATYEDGSSIATTITAGVWTTSALSPNQESIKWSLNWDGSERASSIIPYAGQSPSSSAGSGTSIAGKVLIRHNVTESFTAFFTDGAAVSQKINFYHRCRKSDSIMLIWVDDRGRTWSYAFSRNVNDLDTIKTKTGDQVAYFPTSINDSINGISRVISKTADRTIKLYGEEPIEVAKILRSVVSSPIVKMYAGDRLIGVQVSDGSFTLHNAAIGSVEFEVKLPSNFVQSL